MARRGTGSHWSPNEVERLRALAGKGLSAAKIADSLGPGYTRNQVIGKCRRTGIDLKHGQNTGSPDTITRRTAAKKKPKLQLAPTVDDPTESTGFAADDTRNAVLGLRDGCCKWPLGDPKQPSFGFCMAPKPAGQPYCPGHTERAFQPKTSSQKRDDRLARY